MEHVNHESSVPENAPNGGTEIDIDAELRAYEERRLRGRIEFLKLLDECDRTIEDDKRPRDILDRLFGYRTNY